MGVSDQDRARGGMRREGQAREPALHSHHALRESERLTVNVAFWVLTAAFF